MTDTLPPIDALRYREVMGHYPTGVTVVSGIADDGEPVGMVVGTFTSVSLDPPLVAFLPTLTSRRFARIRTARSFCINVLAYDQVELCRTMSSPTPTQFADIEWTVSPSGAPAIAGAVAHIHCVPREAIEAGDHFIQLCEVESMQVARQVTPLLFFQGGYGGFSPRGMTARGDADLISGIRLAGPGLAADRDSGPRSGLRGRRARCRERIRTNHRGDGSRRIRRYAGTSRGEIADDAATRRGVCCVGIGGSRGAVADDGGQGP